MLLPQRDVAKQLGIAPQIVAASTKSGILNHVGAPQAPLQPPVPFGNTNILDRVLVDLTDAQYFSRWRILNYSLGPCGTAILAT